MSHLGGMVRKLVQIKRITKRGLGEKPQSLGNFCNFSAKNCHFSAIKFQKIRMSFKRTKLPSPFSPPYLQIKFKNQFKKRLHFGLNVLKHLAMGEGAEAPVAPPGCAIRRKHVAT